MWPCNRAETSVCHTRHAPHKDIVPLAAQEHIGDGSTFMLSVHSFIPELLTRGGGGWAVAVHGSTHFSCTQFSSATLVCTPSHGTCCSMLGMHTTPRCDENHYVSHEGELQESTREALRAALPWALRFNPARYRIVTAHAKCADPCG